MLEKDTMLVVPVRIVLLLEQLGLFFSTENVILTKVCMSYRSKKKCVLSTGLVAFVIARTFVRV